MLYLSTVLLAFTGKFLNYQFTCKYTNQSFTCPALTSVSGLELENFSQLVQKVLHLDHRLHQSIQDYQAAGYYIFGNLSKSFLLNEELKQKMHSLPQNPFIQDNAEVREVYNELKLNELLWETLIDPVKLSDAFKVSILSKGLTIEPPGLEVLLGYVKQIIQKEDIIKHNYSIPLPMLEDLYINMSIAGVSDFMITPNSFKYIGSAIQDYCAISITNCDTSLKVTAGMFLETDQKIHDILPFDSEEKIHQILAVLPGYFRLRDMIGQGLKSNHLECAPSGCWKRVYATDEPETTTASV